jgi:hypothetical protein
LSQAAGTPPRQLEKIHRDRTSHRSVDGRQPSGVLLTFAATAARTKCAK